MVDMEELERENQVLKERLTRLNEASLRINQSLDLQTVLHEVLESAQALTGAHFGAIVVLDESEQYEGVIIRGMSRQKREELHRSPDGPKIFKYLSNMRGPLRLGSLTAHLNSQGFHDFPTPFDSDTFLGTPLRHRGSRIGTFFLSEKGGRREFDSDDEDILLMFATQAALAIANARRHTAELRAKADLETLVNTTPVGVLLIDAKGKGEPVSTNREARRMIESLLGPGGTVERLAQEATVKRADGREVSLDELSVLQALHTGEMVRAEEIVLEAPDGRSVRILMNASPIHSEEGELDALVVTTQDMTPIEELERMRAEFVGVVSHELRTPLTSIKGSVATLLEFLDGRDSTETVQLVRIIEGQANRMRDLINDLLDVAHIEAGTLSVAPEPSDLPMLLDDARNTFLSGGGRDNVRMELPPDLPHVMADSRRVAQVLGNLLSNADRHSPKSSIIRMMAELQNLHVAVSVSDEGKGIPEDRIPHLFRKFSRIHRDGEPGGAGLEDTGLGLAICKGIVEAHGGRIWAESAGLGLGARFTFTLPVAKSAPVTWPDADSGALDHARDAVGSQLKVLALDDDPLTLRYVRDVLTNAGYIPITVAEPRDVPVLMKREEPDLVLLDLMLSGSSGMELMQEILNIADVPVIFLSAYNREETVARALESGAADYVVKPFSSTELVARIGAALRRWSPGARQQTELYVQGDLVIDYDERRVTLAGDAVHLTATEFDLLSELSVNAGRVLTHEYLLQRVWGQDHTSSLVAIRSVVRRLRRKLGDEARSPTYIFSEPRVGYRMRKNPTAEA